MDSADATLQDARFCPRCGKRFVAFARTCTIDGADLMDIGRDEDLAGTVLNRKYLLLRRLGQGSFGSVYLVWHLLGRARMTVKLLHPEYCEDAAARRRFLKEAQALLRFRSPHAVVVHDVDEDRSGRPFIVMDYLDGASLDRVLEDLSAKGGELPLRDVLAVCTRIAEALDAAHRAGVVHRDLKPANVMVRQETDGTPDVKVVDFGVARLRPCGDFAQSLTQSCPGVVGTPAYMSPEQAQGLEVDGRADLYSLGVMLYEMVAGRRPFQGINAAMMLLAQVTETPVPPGCVRARADAPDGLDRLVMSLLAKDPADRPADAREVACRLRALADEVERRAPRRAPGDARPTLSFPPVRPSTVPTLPPDPAHDAARDHTIDEDGFRP